VLGGNQLSPEAKRVVLCAGPGEKFSYARLKRGLSRKEKLTGSGGDRNRKKCENDFVTGRKEGTGSRRALRPAYRGGKCEDASNREIPESEREPRYGEGETSLNVGETDAR